MPVTGIHHLVVTTTDYDATLTFWRDLGFVVDFETGHGSAKLDPPTPGPYVFVDTCAPDETPSTAVYLDVDGHEQLPGNWEDTHWGTVVLPRVDPDGRTVWLQEVGPDGH